mgnify:FL=1
MIKVKNKTKGPVSVIVKSFSAKRQHTKSLTSLLIPGLKTVLISDERAILPHLEKLRKEGLISFTNE